MKTLIKNWNLHGERLTLAAILAFANPKINVITTGPPGQGKSHSSVLLSKELNLPFVEVFAGHCTAKGFFELVQENPNNCIIIDESATELCDSETTNILRSALYGGEIRWKTDGEEKAVLFQGNIIMNTNSLPTGFNSRAVIDRCLLLHHQLTVKEVLDKMAGTMAQKCDEGVSTIMCQMARKVIDCRSAPSQPAREDKERALALLKEYFGNNTFHDYASMRRLEQLSQIIATYRRVFDEEITVEECKMLLPVTKEMSVETIIKQMLKHEPKAQIAKYLVKEEGISRRTAYRRLQECEVAGYEEV